jgi:hypothetical protein
MTRALTLSSALGLRPLDRVMIVSQAALREVALFGQQNGRRIEPPFWYFQYVDEDGHLVLRAPGGSVTAVSAHDVCDVIAGEPVKVLAMPLATWRERTRLPIAERQSEPAPACYASASVLYARRDRWGNHDYLVRFDDPSLNSSGDGTTRTAPLSDEDHHSLQARTRRTLMPVTSWPSRGTNWSADHGVLRAQAIVRADAAAFVRSALSGDRSRVELLAVRDAAVVGSNRASRRKRPGPAGLTTG